MPLDKKLVAEKATHFKSGSQLPEGALFIRTFDEATLFNINGELYSYNQKEDTIVKDLKVAEQLKLPHQISLKTEDSSQNIWLSAQLDKNDTKKTRLLGLKNTDDTYTIKKVHAQRITQDVGVSLFADNARVVWYGGAGILARQDLGKESNHNIDYNTHIRKVTINNDSILHAGTRQIDRPVNLPYQKDVLRFEFAATSFDQEKSNQFQYQLSGFDKQWSPWSSETKKDYTNLPEGEYMFRVRSKNIYGHIGSVASYHFKVSPPWYRTWWAYLIYSCLFGLFIYTVIYYRSWQLQQKNQHLEKVVQNRTKEIEHKNALLTLQTEELVQLSNTKAQFYDNITHEFRTPLTVILGMVDTLKSYYREEKNEEIVSATDMIDRNGKKLLQLVNEFLDTSKIENGIATLHLEQIDVIPFIKYLSESFESLAEAKQIKLTVYSEIETLPMDVDTNKLAAIVTNLISNAIKFTPKHGKVIIHINKNESQDNEFLVLKINDSGIGIAQNHIANLFDRFYQIPEHKQQNMKGSGIGLALVKDYVNLMQGTIDVKSKLNQGSTFIVNLPITNTASIAKPESITKLPKYEERSVITENITHNLNTNLPLVLIIEDNFDVTQYLKSCLKDAYEVLHAINGQEGINVAFEHMPDIIISDVVMPIKTGFDVCQTLKNDERTDHIPIILLTAKITIEDKLTGLSHGADAYLAKPFLKEELFTRLNQLIIQRKKLISKLEKNGLSSILNEKEISPQTKFLQQAITLIHEQLDDAQFGPGQLAQKMNLSESQVYRKLKAITDKSTAIFIRSIRLQKAKQLLQKSNKTISEIAYEVGFNNPSWFSRAFKEEFGVSPSDYTNS